MATVLESLVVPRASLFPSSTISASSSTGSSLPSSRVSLKSREFRGVRVRVGASTRTAFRSASSRSGIVRRAGRIVCESSEATVQLPSVTQDTWKQLVLESDLPVMVEFWAPWCGPCRIIQPTIDELSKQYAGKLKVFKVNTDESANIATDCGVRSIPTFIIFKKGEKKEAVIGAVPKDTLKTTIEKFL